MTHRPLATIDELFAVLREGERHLDEPDVDLLHHGLQCAAILADLHADDEQLQVAGLVHDLGGVIDAEAAHDRLGAALVAPLLGPRVAALVGGHVAAKRYLVLTEPGYADLLSARSVQTLAWQGGPADDDVARAVESSPDRDALLALRRADDRAKVPDAAVAPLESWRPVVARVAAAAAG
jgi:predicted HD phosphohydrolase